MRLIDFAGFCIWLLVTLFLMELYGLIMLLPFTIYIIGLIGVELLEGTKWY